MHIESGSLPLMNTLKYVFPFTFPKVRKSNKNKTMNFLLLGGQLLQWNLQVIYGKIHTWDEMETVGSFGGQLHKRCSKDERGEIRRERF